MDKRVITFAFRPHVSRQRQEELLTEIAAWKQVDQAAHLKPDTKLDALLRLCYAYLNDEADTHEVTRRLVALPEIESATEPTPRHLL